MLANLMVKARFINFPPEAGIPARGELLP